MVAGAAALMLEAYPGRAPWIIKTMLMNTADSDVLTDPVFLPKVLAPVTRIGAGELQVNKAIASTTAAWDSARRTGKPFLRLSQRLGHRHLRAYRACAELQPQRPAL
ncbi:MAG: hypothetical protein WDO56_22625 [Gammaproteobacteria bacterium]